MSAVSYAITLALVVMVFAIAILFGMLAGDAFNEDRVLDGWIWLVICIVTLIIIYLIVYSITPRIAPWL